MLVKGQIKGTNVVAEVITGCYIGGQARKVGDRITLTKADFIFFFNMKMVQAYVEPPKPKEDRMVKDGRTSVR